MTRIKSKIGGWLPWLRPYYYETRLAVHAIRNGLWRSIARRRRHTVFKQSVRYWATELPAFEDSAMTIAHFRSIGLEVKEGSNTFYLPPQPGLRNALGAACDHYPPDSGFKFLRNFGQEEADSYLPPAKQTVLKRRLMGPPQEHLLSANYLNALGLGPRVSDYCFFRTAGLLLPAFVVDHVEGDSPTDGEYTGFIQRMKNALAETELRITVPNWNNKVDFRGPDCNGNLIATPDRDALYVDFQNFGIRNPEDHLATTVQGATETLHFGKQRAYRRRPFLYQSIPSLKQPSKRDTAGRFATIRKLLADEKIDLDGRLVLDIGCNAGVMLHHALAVGAGWGIGWDRPEVAEQARRLSDALAFTRTTFNRADLDADYDFVATTPEWLRPQLRGCIVFFLSIRRHIGIPSSLISLPWEGLVYEGHQGESLEDSEELVQPLLSDGREITNSLYMRDGNSRPRPLLILRSRIAEHAYRESEPRAAPAES